MFSSVGTCAYELVEKVGRNCVNRRLNFRNKVLPKITFSASLQFMASRHSRKKYVVKKTCAKFRPTKTVSKK